MPTLDPLHKQLHIARDEDGIFIPVDKLMALLTIVRANNATLDDKQVLRQALAIARAAADEKLEQESNK